MKRAVVLLLLFVCATVSNAQNLFYYPDGKKYIGKAKTINDINKELAKGLPVYKHFPRIKDDYSAVGFKMFTDIPIWVITEHPKRIKEYINSFDLSEFLHSWEFEFEIEMCIEKGNLTDIYLLESLGRPDKKTKLGTAKITLEEWYYSNFGISFYLTDGIVTSYIKVG